MAVCGGMIPGLDSHARYGAPGTMGCVGEGEPELVKQLLGEHYKLKAPQDILVYPEGEPLQSHHVCFFLPSNAQCIRQRIAKSLYRGFLPERRGAAISRFCSLLHSLSFRYNDRQ